MAPSLGEASPTIMKGILIAGVFVAFAITVIDSLDCRQCSLTTEGTESCIAEASPCDNNEEFVSCVESSVNSTLGGSRYLYTNKFCSKDNCTTVNNNPEVSFTVHVSDDQQFDFVSQCCQGEACNDNKEVPEEESESARADTQIQCPSCYSSNTTTDCKEEIRQCSQGERCVHILADHVNGSVHNKVELKGCSNIDEATCDILTPGNVTVGEFTFQTVSCKNEITTTTPTTVTTTPSTSTSIKASFISSVFGSLLLLKLLF